MMGIPDSFARLRQAAATAIALAIAAIAFAASAAAAAVPGPLVDAEWLKANKDAVVILDVQKKPEAFTEKGHIPGARLVPWKSVRTTIDEDGVSYDKMRLAPADFAKLMSDMGVGDDSAVVLTMSGTSPSDVYLATRLYWQLKFVGHDNVAILDGGNAAWSAAKHPISKDAAEKPVAGSFTVRGVRDELLATTNQVAASVAADSTALVDARPLDYHLGLEQKKSYVFAAGHIPKSKVVPNDLLLAHNPPLRFRKLDEISLTLRALGVDLAAVNTTYCNSGHLASGLWFAMSELGGAKGTRLYDGSMHAWTKDKSRPVTSGQLN